MAIARDLIPSPVAIVVVPFAIVFWPLLCLMDLTEIPKKQRLKQKQLEIANTKLLQQTIAQEKRDRQQAMYQSMVGKLCETNGVLSPMGQIRIDGQNWDAISTDGYIPTGQQVVVTGVRGAALEVSVSADQN